MENGPPIKTDSDREFKGKSSLNISNHIALNATLAASIQVACHVKPGNVHRFQDFTQTKMEHFLSSAVALNIPMSQMATRGIMVGRGLIDIDETDMGWIIAEAAKEGVTWHSGGMTNLGMLFLFSPIAAAAGYLLSSSSNANDDFVDISQLPSIAVEFLENTTPEDTVNIFSMLYQLNTEVYPRSLTIDISLPESINELLESEINLYDFYKSYQNRNLIFKELSEGYPLSFGEGFSAFSEAINEGESMIDAISHTYVNLLSMHPDSMIFQRHGREMALKIRQRAKEIVENGGYLTATGKNLMRELETDLTKTENVINPGTIADLTANVTFLATLSGIRP
ncbi:MAG: triphosphoribosyl-dephospho-CoA synthase [Candidatus Kariarchaeaceae archaeon]|jgi:triphosphoribosyl-dephospho-CoA synthetase